MLYNRNYNKENNVNIHQSLFNCVMAHNIIGFCGSIEIIM